MALYKLWFRKTGLLSVMKNDLYHGGSRTREMSLSCCNVGQKYILYLADWQRPWTREGRIKEIAATELIVFGSALNLGWRVKIKEQGRAAHGPNKTNSREKGHRGRKDEQLGFGPSGWCPNKAVHSFKEDKRTVRAGRSRSRTCRRDWGEKARRGALHKEEVIRFGSR